MTSFTAQQDRHRELLAAYLDAFDAHDLDAVARHLHPDVQFDRGEWPALSGRAAFVEFYEHVWAHADEHVTLGATSWDGGSLQARLAVTLEVHRDLPDFPAGPLAAGDRLVDLPNHLRYWFAGDEIIRIVDLQP